MPTTIKMPSLEIIFKGIGATAIARGERGSAALIVVDETEGAEMVKYKTIADFTSEEQAKYTADNVLAIKDALEGTPLELFVFRLKAEGKIADLFKKIGGAVPRNSWIGVQSATEQHHNDLVTWIKAERKNNKKRYKALVYKATTPDDMGVVNLTNEKITFSDDRGEKAGSSAIAWGLGFLAGMPLTMSAIAKPIGKFSSVVEPEDLDTAIGNGEFILFNDEGVVKVTRGVNSLVTTGQDVTEEMCFINTVEKMDLIYCDIFTAWNNSYKGKYPNILDNQMLLISAIRAYFKEVARDYILDPNYDNTVNVDVEAQKLANYAKYGEETVESWDENKAMEMTVSTKVFLKANIKIPGIMEDLKFEIYM